uniref:Uncharacterized protein n=2 Tax=cellular organisms TaxID=131567 RepID=A0A914YQC2_9BILA
MGLFVAIPALFGYNRLIGRNKDVSADMRVFVDEFVTRLAEIHGQNSAPGKTKHDKHEAALAQGADLDLANTQAAGSA